MAFVTVAATAALVGTGLKAVGGIGQAIGSGIKAKRAKEEAEEAQNKLDKQKEMFMHLDTSNPYLNMENVADDLVVNQHFRAGAKIHSITNATSLLVDRSSTNTAAATGQIVKFLGVTTAYTSPAATKSILIGGTFSNLTQNDINVYVEVVDQSASVSGAAGISSVQLASDIPIPNGSSFVISEAGKTILEALDQVTVYCDTANAVDVNLAILSGVS